MDFDETIITKPAAPKKPGCTFQSMGLSRPVLRAVERKGYKLATPIQRKCIPPIMANRDLVAMARTGSGKSAAFLLPLIDKLKIRQPRAEIRALILAPTRELASQTFKFVREFTKYTNLISKLIIGGESISKDFETVTSTPDILVATPGRLAHVLVEMKFKLNNVEVVVFDEADRLFEPGFKEFEQVNEICQRLPESKQTLLFSATMPQKLADFAKVGLKNPLFIRLDVETNLSDTLKSIHLHCNQTDKFAILVHLLKNFVDKQQMTVVFMPTKHHIEYTKMLLDNTRMDCCCVYSSMDPEARKINIDKFTKKSCRIMLVTDIAARGIDIPLLDIVINFNFPFRPKLYIHRVGRVARAGRSGCAISLISHDETPYLHALHIFFGLPLTIAAQLEAGASQPADINDLPDKVLGTVPQNVLDDENDILKRWHEHNEDLQAMVKVCDNAMKPYLKTREPPAPFSVKAAKDIFKKPIGVHPLFKMILQNGGQDANLEDEVEESNFLGRIKAYKPQATIFEVGHIKGNKRTEAFEVMQKKRTSHDKVARKRKMKDLDDDDDELQKDDFQSVKNRQPSMNITKKGFEDSKFYLKYQPDDFAREKGLELDKNSFNNDIKRATLDLVADDEDQLKRQKHQMIWDRKRKKYVRADQLFADDKKSKKIKTESGAYISASYQSGLFEKWKSQSKFEQKNSDDENENVDGEEPKSGGSKAKPNLKRLRQNLTKLQPAKARRELKNPEEIMKERNIKEKREAILRLKTQAKAKRTAQRGGNFKGKAGPDGQKKGGKGVKVNNKRSGGGKQRGGKGSATKGKQAPAAPSRKGYRPPRVDGGRGRRRR